MKVGTEVALTTVLATEAWTVAERVERAGAVWVAAPVVMGLAGEVEHGPAALQGAQFQLKIE
jgi:hypothetical protein